MTPSPIAWNGFVPDLSLHFASFDHSPAPSLDPIPAPDDEKWPGADEADREPDDDEPDTETLADVILELDGLDDDEPLPEHGDFWIDTDDVDAV